jgi:magnesium transporter
VPKVDIYGDQLFVVAKTAHLENDKIIYGETCIFVGRQHVITVRHGSARSHQKLREQLEQAPQLLSHGPDYVLHGILDFIVDGYLPLVETIEDRVLDIEKHILISFLEPEQIRRIFRMRRQVIKFQRVIGPMAEVASKLAHLELPCVDGNARPFFRDVHDHVRRVENMVIGLRDIVTSVFEAANLLEQQRQGAITRQLAAWAAILAVPTAIAGIYGMNFENMPELKTEYGYYVVLAVIVVLCSTLYYRFKKARWV